MTVGRVLTIETVPLKLARKLWAGPDYLNPDQTYFPDEYLHHVLYITRIYFIYGTTQSELIGLLYSCSFTFPSVFIVSTARLHASAVYAVVVCLSVCLSVTSRCSTEMAKSRIT